MANEWDAIRARVEKENTLPEPATSDYEDVYKGAVGGLGRAATGVLGMPGDIQHGTEAAVDYGLGLAGLPPVNQQRRAQGTTRFPTSAEIQQAVEPYTGKFYEPQTDLGKVASRAVEFAPAAMTPWGGMAASRNISSIPGLVVRQRQLPTAIAARAANTLGGAAGSVAGEELTKDTPYANYGQAAGALLGGGGAARVLSPMTAAPKFSGGAKAVASAIGAAAGHQFGGGLPGAIIGGSVPYATERLLRSGPVRGYLGNTLVPQSSRDIVTQALLQQAVTQPSVVERAQRTEK
jgi:hypothetical protein